MARDVTPGRFRRRLTVAFALVGGLAAVILAVGSYTVVRESRLDDSLERSLEQARFNLVLADEIVGPSTGETGADALLVALERRGGFVTVGKEDGGEFSSSLSVGAAHVPEELERLVQGGRLAYERVTVGATPYLVVGGRVPGTSLDLYFFFSEEQLHDDLAQLRTILLVGTVLIVLLSALVGALVARRTLAPVGDAAEAAHAIAEGLLETRLDVSREDEFGAWARSFNEMADALEAKISALSAAEARERRFTADVAHELRTPLTALVAEAALLAEHVDSMPSDARRPAELLIADVERMRRLVEDLIEISRFDAGAEVIRPAPLDLQSLVEGAVAARGWNGRVVLEGTAVTLSTDARRVERIVVNLIGNALEHGGGQATVRVGPDGAGAIMEVVDEGPGIPAEHAAHVFERFYKADPSHTGSGSGLGLAIAGENARLLGGRIDVASTPGAGSRFTLRLPPVTEPLRGGDGDVSAAVDDPVDSEPEDSS